MGYEKKWLVETIVGSIAALASAGVTLLAYDAQLDGAILGELRPRIRWAWRSLVAAVASTWAKPEIVAGAEEACENSPWRPTWNRP